MFKQILSQLKKKWWILALGIGLVGVAFVSLREPIQNVESIQVKLGRVRQFILEEGKTRLAREYTVNLPVAGELSRLPWREGDWVEKGQVLIALNRLGRSLEIAGLRSRLAEISAQTQGIQSQKPKSSELAVAQAQIEQARLQRSQSQRQREAQEAELAQLERHLNRQETLYREGTLTLAQLEDVRKQVLVMRKQAQQALLEEKKAHQALRVAELQAQRLKQTLQDPEYLRGVYQAQREQVNAQLRQKQDEWGKTVITAPVSGPVLEVQSRDATVLPAGSPILKLGDLNSLEIEVDILSEEIHQVKPGQKVEISGKALQDQQVLGKVARIYPAGFTKLSALGVEQQRIKVIVSAPPAALHLYPGTRVDVKIITAEKERVLVVPERALFKQDEQWQVFKIEAERLVLQTVKVGLKNDDEAEILQGLKAGDEIVSELETAFKPGSKVQINPKKAEKL